MRVCIVCGTEIPTARIKALPNTRTCIEHSTAEKFTVNVVQHGNIEDDGFQEFEIIRDKELSQKLEQYRSQLGTYK